LSLQIAAVSNFEFSEKLFQSTASRYDEKAEQRARNWQALITNNKQSALEDQLFETKIFFNKLEFKDDLKHWGKNDYWATPLEFLGTNAGDCGDFTIAKYVTLLQLGIPDQKLRIMYVTASRLRRAHMVLAYYETPYAVLSTRQH
jgi:predicted transglutaminase-like cysteine proteinase